MKKQLLILTLTFFLFSYNLSASSDSSKYWSAVRTVIHGGTNEVKGMTTDPKGNIIYSGYGYEIGSAKIRALIVGKLNDTLGIVWKQNYHGITDGFDFHVVLADDSSIYIVGHITSYLYFPKDTFVNKSSNPETFFLCLNATNGEFRWVKHFDNNYEAKLAFDGNNDLVLGLRAFNGNQYYDHNKIDSIKVKNYQKGYGYLTIDKTNGNLKNYAFGSDNLIGDVLYNTIEGRKVVSLLQNGTGLILKELNLDNNTITTSAHQINVSGSFYIKLMNTLYHAKDKSWTIFYNHGVDASLNKDIIIGNDTLKIPTITNVYKYSSIVKLDSTLKVKGFITYNNSLKYDRQLISDTNIVFSAGAEGDGYILKNGVMDTMTFLGTINPYHSGYFIVRCNHNFENFTNARVSVHPDNSGGGAGMELKGLILKPNGSYYASVFHQKDIITLPVLTKAALRSWKHVSIIAKYGDASPDAMSVNHPSLDNSSNLVYPNPTNGIVNIENATTVQSINVYNLSGQQVKTFTDVDFTQGINLQDLTNGVYLLQIVGDDGINMVKVLKE